MHHIVPVVKGGGNALSNLIALCPTCHALHHRGEISQDSIYAWKSILVSLSHAFDTATIDDLLFLAHDRTPQLTLSGDGVCRFSRLIGAGLADFTIGFQEGPFRIRYRIRLTPRGKQLINAWRSGNRDEVRKALGG